MNKNKNEFSNECIYLQNNTAFHVIQNNADNNKYLYKLHNFAKQPPVCKSG